MGWMGTSMPLTDETTTVIFPPFEATHCDVSQLDECHAAYLEHLKKYFDLHKGFYGMKDVEMVFVGSDFQDTDPVARALIGLGIYSNPKPKRSGQEVLPQDKAKRRLDTLMQQVGPSLGSMT